MDSTVMSWVLREFRAWVGEGAAWGVLDRAGWHVSQRVEGVDLEYLPPYSPELQPAERMWPLGNEAVANRYFETLEEMMEVVAERCQVLSADPATVRKHTPLPLVAWDEGINVKGYHMLELAGRDDLSLDKDDSEPPNAAFRVPHPETGGGWVAVLYTQTVAPPSIPGPWRNYGGGGIGPERILWVNGRGEWGYSEHHVAGKDSLYQMKGSLEALRKSIRLVREIEGFRMVPEEHLKRALQWNAEDGWPLERLVALERGDFEVDNPAMKYWK